jgi:hypothetical protein
MLWRCKETKIEWDFIKMRWSYLSCPFLEQTPLDKKGCDYNLIGSMQALSEYLLNEWIIEELRRQVNTLIRIVLVIVSRIHRPLERDIIWDFDFSHWIKPNLSSSLWKYLEPFGKECPNIELHFLILSNILC